MRNAVVFFCLQVWLFMEESDSSHGAKVTSLFILLTIIFSIVCFTMQTMPELRNVDVRMWDIAEVCTTMVFTVEYLVRLSVRPGPYQRVTI